MSSEFSSSKSSAHSESGASTTADTNSVVVTGSAASATVWAGSLEFSPSTNTCDWNTSSRKFGLYGWDEPRFQCSIAGTGSAKSLIDSRSVNLRSVSSVLRLVLINFSWLKPRSTSVLEEFASSQEHWWCFSDLYVISEFFSFNFTYLPTKLLCWLLIHICFA